MADGHIEHQSFRHPTLSDPKIAPKAIPSLQKQTISCKDGYKINASQAQSQIRHWDIECIDEAIAVDIRLNHEPLGSVALPSLALEMIPRARDALIYAAGITSGETPYPSMKALRTQIEALDRQLDSLQAAIDSLAQQIALRKVNQILDEYSSEKIEESHKDED